MSKFLETLERVQLQQHEVSNLFSNGNEDGTSIKSLRRNNPNYKLEVARCAKFVAEVYSGQRPIWQLQEVMTTSDFPILFGDILDRSILAAYNEWPISWGDVAKRVILNDFKNAKVYKPLLGIDNILEKVGEDAPYPEAGLTEQAPFEWYLEKYGRRVPFSWEAMINDNLDQLKDIPERLGRAARRTEDWTIANMFMDANGPHASLYTSGNKNIVNITNGALANNPPLSSAGLKDGYTVLAKMLGEDGWPIMREVVTLVVGPSLEITARTLLNATELHITDPDAGGVPDDGSGSGYQRLNAPNWMRNRLRLVVNPYMPLITTTGTVADTQWFLFASPTYSREAMRIGFLRGHETPELWMKSPNAMRIGGGDVSPMSGDFDTDSIHYRVRHIMGTTYVDGKATVASKGTGS